MASLYEKRGFFYVVFCNSSKEPTRKKLSLKTNDRREAEALKGKLEFDCRFGRFDPWTDDPFTYDAPKPPPAPAPAPNVGTLGEAFERFIGSRAATCRPPTVEHYRTSLAPLVAFLGPDAPVTALSSEGVGRWLRSLDVRPTSKQTYVQRVGIFGRFLVADGVLPCDPTKALPRPRLPETLGSKLMTEAHLQAFIREARRDPRTRYVAALALVGFDLALRRKELVALRVGWIDFEKGVLTIPCDATFTTKSGRPYVKPISARALDVLAQICTRRREPGERVFLNIRRAPLTPKRLTRTFKSIARRAGLPESLSLHSLRHGGITRIAAAGLSEQALKRFSGNTSDAVRKYIHLAENHFDDDIRAALNRVR